MAGGAGVWGLFCRVEVCRECRGDLALATARMGSLAVCSLLVGLMAFWANAGEAKVRLTRPVVVWALGAVLLDTSGNLLFIAATQAGRLDVLRC